MNLDVKIEAILFAEGGSLEKSFIMDILNIQKQELDDSIQTLKERYADRAVYLIETENSVAIVVSKEITDLITKDQEKSLEKELSKSALETLSIILYQPETTKSDIDYIRGVNSSVILRNLLMRGLIEKIPHKTDSRKNIFIPTIDLLRNMGIQQVQELPEYESINNKLREVTKETDHE